MNGNLLVGSTESRSCSACENIIALDNLVISIAEFCELLTAIDGSAVEVKRRNCKVHLFVALCR